jgi:hypothetical protein
MSNRSSFSESLATLQGSLSGGIIDLRETLRTYIIDQLELEASASEVPFPQYANDRVGFARDVLKIKVLTAEQIAICDSIQTQTVTNVRAANGVGKSFMAAVLALHWVFSVGGKCVTTAPNAEQVDQILWSEIRGMYDSNKSVLGGKRTQITLYLTEKAQAFGFATKDYDANAFQGKHGEKLLLILDEACGITREIDDAAISCITGAENRMLRIGNPIADNNPFADACASQSIAIASWNHPNVSWAYHVDSEDGIHKLKPEIADRILKPDDDPTKPTDPVKPQKEWDEDLPRDVIPGACSINWIEMVRSLKGETSTFWQSRVEAHFPEDTDRSIVPRSWFKAARARYDADPEKWDRLVEDMPARHALDVGDGGDPHAHAMVRGCVIYAASEMPTIGDRLDVSRAADWGIEHLKANKGGIAVDRIGVGAGALSKILLHLSEVEPVLGLTCWATGVNFGQVVKKRKRHLSLIDDDATETLNIRAKQYWEFREACRLGEVVIAPLGVIEERVAEEFAKHYYEDTPSGKIKMEDKRITRRRLRRSPNLADVIVMSWNSEDDTDTKVLEQDDEAAIGITKFRP